MLDDGLSRISFRISFDRGLIIPHSILRDVKKENPYPARGGIGDKEVSWGKTI